MPRKSTDLPAELTSSRIKLLEREMKSGTFREHAAVLAGLKPSVLKDWVRVGRENPDSPLGKVAARLDRAAAQHIARQQKRIAASKDWKAAAWDAERHDRVRYHLPTRVIFEEEREQLVSAFEAAAAEVVTDAEQRKRLLARTHEILVARLGDVEVGGSGSET